MKSLSKNIFLALLLALMLAFALLSKQFYKINSKYSDLKKARSELYMDISNIRAKCKISSKDLMQMRQATPVEILKRHYLSSEYILDIYQLMKDVHEVLGKHKITYWVDSGTLIGVVRHKGQIPFDDDIDIFVLEEYEATLKQECFEYLKELGYQVSNFDNAWYQVANITSGAYMDIFIAQKKQKIFNYKNDKAQEVWPKGYYKEEHLFPLKLYDFGEIQVYGPKNPDDFLSRAYGSNYKSKAIFSGNHYVTGSIGQVLEIDVKEDASLTMPAMPTGPLLDRVK